jgi:uncharacterized protein (DUF2235 family)
MDKKLIICADGTWNDEDGASGQTNVAKIHHALQNKLVEGVNQSVCYVTGVGTRWGERLRGGALGYGLSKNILEAYRFLVEDYDEGDKLYFFGFSRGAYTVRSLAGFIRNSGLLRRGCLGKIADAFALYRNRSRASHPTSEQAEKFRKQYAYEPDIEFIGVWDTVGSLGIPLTRLRVLSLATRLANSNWQFHDTKLSSKVKNAFHAVSIHERRGTFTPTLWEKQDHSINQVLEQVWFPGVHCDVGGGYRATGLSDESLLWMVDRARKCGLLFRDDGLNPGFNVAPDPIGRLHDSYAFPFNIIDWLSFRFGGVPRSFDNTPVYCESMSHSAIARYHFKQDTEWPNTFQGQLRGSTSTSVLR